MSRDLQLKVMLSPEEYIAFRAIAEDRGQSQSGLARQLIKQAISEFAQSTTDGGERDTDEVVQNKAKS